MERMAGEHHVRLGVVPLTLDIGFLPLSAEPWEALNVEFLQSGIFHKDEEQSIDILVRCLKETSLEAVCERKIIRDEVVVRVSIIPSDAPRSRWNVVSAKHRLERSKLVQSLFGIIRIGWDSSSTSRLLEKTEEDLERMADIYATIPSPTQHPLQPNSYKDQELQARLLLYEDPDIVNTNMHRYQIRSVAKMLQMETEPGKLIDPHYTSFRDARDDSRRYYVNLGTWDIQISPGHYDLPRGGILCEQMGTGKTLMCLALVVSTLHQPCTPPQDQLDISPVVTLRTLESYPSEQVAHYRCLLGITPPQEHHLPSLSDFCAGVLAAHDPSAERDRDSSPSVRSLLAKHRPLYFGLPREDECARAKKQKTPFQSRVVYLANTTLIVVPAILVPQWDNEISKHLDRDRLKVYVHTNEELPPVDFLIDHDIVIMDIARFSYESTQYREMRQKEPSVLLQVRWKRMIFDEGHVAGSKTSNAMVLATALNVERRWLVSGTPTRNLRQGTEISTDLTPSKIQSTPTRWPKSDIEDAERLGVMIGNFLGAEPFKSSANDARFIPTVIGPLRYADGPLFGAVRRLKHILSHVVVKHQPGTIERETPLPPLTLGLTTLRFTPMQKLTYNVLAALITANVYDSNFEDEDYFLHAKNKAAFNQVIANLHLACCWYSASEMDAAGALSRIDAMSQKSTFDADHLRKIREAGRHIREALDDPSWHEWMTHGISVPFKVDTLPLEVRTAYSDSAGGESDLIDTDSLLLLRTLNTNGQTMNIVMDRAARQRLWKTRALETQAQRDEALRAEKERRSKTASHSTTAAGAPPKMKSSPQKRKRAATGFAEDEEQSRRIEEAERNANAHLPRPFPETITVTSRSSKINFVLETIRTAPEDKFVIFGDTYDLGHVTEALDLIEIRSCFAGYSGGHASRSAAIKEFEHPDVKVFLSDLKLAARGLNLVSANRMIFLSPVWNHDVQAQAIKRVHRIGQIRPTKVQILVTEGTFEEDIAKRSSASRSEAEGVTYSRKMIQDPQFVHPVSNEAPKFVINMIPHKERMTTTIHSTGSTPPESGPRTPIRTNVPAGPMTPVDVTLGGKLSFVETTTTSERPFKRPRVAFAAGC